MRAREARQAWQIECMQKASKAATQIHVLSSSPTYKESMTKTTKNLQGKKKQWRQGMAVKAEAR